MKEREERFVGFLHREEANTLLVKGDVAGAIRHYTEAAQFALRGSAADSAGDGAGLHGSDVGDDDEAEGGDARRSEANPASCMPDLDFPGTEGWALALVQRAAAHWKVADVENCACDCLAVLRALSRDAPSEGEVVSGSGVSSVVSGVQEEQQECSDDTAEKSTEQRDEAKEAKEEREKLERRNKDRRERIRARSAELLGRSLSASQVSEPWAALLALNTCLRARPNARPTVLLQLQHVRHLGSLSLTPCML